MHTRHFVNIYTTQVPKMTHQMVYVYRKTHDWKNERGQTESHIVLILHTLEKSLDF